MSAYPVAYNGTIPTGGDSLTEDLNIYYNVWIDYDDPLQFKQDN